MSKEMVQSIYQFFSRTLQLNSLQQIVRTNRYDKSLRQIVTTNHYDESLRLIVTTNRYYKLLWQIVTTNHCDESLQQIVIKKDELRRINVFLEISNLCQYSTFFNNLTRNIDTTKRQKKRWKNSCMTRDCKPI